MKPLLLSPVGKDYLWGGNRLNDRFSKNIDMYPLAETWECSVHIDGPSVVLCEEFYGKTLREVLKEHPEFLGTKYKSVDEFPILIKLIDANKPLSIQVHPDDDYARIHENGSLGKTEMWYVVDSKEDSELIYGFNRDVNSEIVRTSIEDGTLEKYLQKEKIRKDDIFFINPGQIHAIGEGALIAEVQENSNITYRLYDYDREDKNGNKRELHIDKALDVSNLSKSKVPRQPMRVMHYYRGYATELLGRNQYFQVERMMINTERIRELATVSVGEDSFSVLLCIDGSASMITEDENQPIFKGDCIFLPAGCKNVKFHGKSTFLKVDC